MDKGVIAFIQAAVAFVLVAGTGMTGFWLWLRERRRAIPGADHVADALREENARFQADLEARLAELEERLDFAERRLTQEKGTALLPDARARTPV